MSMSTLLEESIFMGFDAAENLRDVTDPPLKILVVDDDALNQRMMQVLLTRDHHQVFIASNGMEALAMVKSQAFDIILMDLQMPVMDGIDASRKIREWENGGGHTYIVALTASYLPEMGQELFEAGIDNYLSKPFEMDHLRQMLRHGLDHRRMKRRFEAVLDSGEAVPYIQDFDYQKGIMQVGGDEETYKELLVEFVQGLPEKLSRLQQFYIASDFKSLSRAAHNLKGVSSSLGALQLSEYAHRLEKQADEGYTGSIKDVILEIKDLSDKFLQKATDFLAGTDMGVGYSH
jgi:CheY-like chemotaxis protein/HPt (histidine-containing phosphotransfer) domain-containing protein